MGDITSNAAFLPSLKAWSQIAARPASAYLTALSIGSISLLWISLVIGQLYRLPLLNQGGGLLLSDIATVAVLTSALLYGLFYVQHDHRLPRPALVTIGFISLFGLWSLVGLAYNHTLPPHGLLIAASYWLRLISTLLLVPAFILLLQHEAA